MKKSVLFVSNTSRTSRPYLDPSTRYRCFNPASALARCGHRTAVISQVEFETSIDDYTAYDYFVFHRPLMNGKIGEFFDTNRNSASMIADFDDFIFDVRHASLTPAYRFRGQTITQVARFIANIASASRHFQNFSLSTRPLASEIGRVFGPRHTVVVSNSLDPAFQGTAKLIRHQMAGKKRPYRFGYFAGTATHDADLASIGPALAEAMHNDPGAKLLVLGPAEIPSTLLSFTRFIEHRKDVVPFHQLPFVMAQVETVVAPLERNEFTECKSGLKFFEAAAVGCSVVATPIPDIDRFDSPLLRKCETEKDWSRALNEPFRISDKTAEEESARICSIVDADGIAKLWLEGFVH